MALQLAAVLQRGHSKGLELLARAVHAARCGGELSHGSLQLARRRRGWRLGRAWQLVRSYEGQCGHTHEFVMKIRTDMWINDESRRPFRSIYHDVIAPMYGRNSSVAFLSSDRFFGGS